MNLFIKTFFFILLSSFSSGGRHNKSAVNDLEMSMHIDTTNALLTRTGQVSFFSYTTAENIEARNTTVLSVIDLSKNEIAISMLMNAFVFKKALMKEHFNESYIESELFPKATFEGKIIDFDPKQEGEQTRIVKGQMRMHGITKDIEIKTTFQNQNGTYTIRGNFELIVSDFDIKIPQLLRYNIAKNIFVKFQFQYQDHE